MRDYAKVAPQFWIGTTGKALRKAGPEAQIVAMYLLTSPHANMLGLYYLPLMFIAHETGLTIEGASEGLRRAIEAQFCAYDEASEMVWVFGMAGFQVGEQLSPADKRCKGIQNDYDSLPENQFLPDFFQKYRDRFHLKKARPGTRGIEAPSKPLRSQEQEQEQEQEKEQEQPPLTPPPSAPGSGAPADARVVGGRRRRRNREEILAPFGPEVRHLANRLLANWPTQDPADGREVRADAAQLGQRLDEILRAHPKVTPDLLLRGAQEYLATKAHRWKAPQFFFGPGAGGERPPWMGYVRALLTRAESRPPQEPPPHLGDPDAA